MGSDLLGVTFKERRDIMSILAAFMVPHPPMIVPAIGRGSEEQILETTRAYERVAREIAALEPETIIITSPHATCYTDYFHISPGRKVKGSFADFRAPQVRFEEEYDEELADRISAIALEENSKHLFIRFSLNYIQ